MGFRSKEGMEVHVVWGSILSADTHAIVNAANSTGAMGRGVAAAIRRACGDEVEQEARQQAPIPVGGAVLTSAGKTRFRGVIHAPTMPEPGVKIPAENVAIATKAALTLADEKGFHSVALPGMGTGSGGLAQAESAKIMLQEINAYTPSTLRSVTLADVDSLMVEAWQSVIKELGIGKS
ncbi:MAG: macro domain-containing protein [Nitrospiraceae bacterium]